MHTGNLTHRCSTARLAVVFDLTVRPNWVSVAQRPPGWGEITLFHRSLRDLTPPRRSRSSRAAAVCRRRHRARPGRARRLVGEDVEISAPKDARPFSELAGKIDGLQLK